MSFTQDSMYAMGFVTLASMLAVFSISYLSAPLTLPCGAVQVDCEPYTVVGKLIQADIVVE